MIALGASGCGRRLLWRGGGYEILTAVAGGKPCIDNHLSLIGGERKTGKAFAVESALLHRLLW